MRPQTERAAPGGGTAHSQDRDVDDPLEFFRLLGFRQGLRRDGQAEAT
jgi:hypothetical protein